MAADHPDAQHREELFQIHRLGNVIGRARLDALGAVALHRLGGQSDDRKRAESGDLPDRPHGFVAVHLRHHDVHQHQIDVRRLLQQLDAGAAIFGVHHFQIVIFQQTGERENIANVVVHHQHLLAEQRQVGFAQLFQDPALLRRQIGFGAMQQQHGFIEQPLARVNAS